MVVRQKCRFQKAHSVPMSASRSIFAHSHSPWRVLEKLPQSRFLRHDLRPSYCVASYQKSSPFQSILHPVLQLPIFSVQRGRTQSHSLLKPPFAMFPVDVVKEDSSRLSQLISEHAPVPTRDMKGEISLTGSRSRDTQSAPTTSSPGRTARRRRRTRASRCT